MSKLSKISHCGFIIGVCCRKQPFGSNGESAYFSWPAANLNGCDIPRLAFHIRFLQKNSLVAAGVVLWTAFVLCILMSVCLAQITVGVVESVVIEVITFGAITLFQSKYLTVHLDGYRSLPPSIRIICPSGVKRSGVLVPVCVPCEARKFFKAMRTYLGKLTFGKGDETIISRWGCHKSLLSAMRLCRRVNGWHLHFIKVCAAGGLLFSLSAIAQGPVTGYCTLGATAANVSGLASTNKLQGVISKCSVQVYLTGTTTPATLFSNASGTPLGNPFTANATTGQWLFYASTSSLYDVVLTGGTAPNTYPAPVTLTGLQPGGGGGGGGSGCVPSGGTNELLKNTGSGTCGASSITDNGTTVVGTEPATFPAVNTVINAGSSLSAAITACGSASTTIQITQTIAVGSGITVPANCTLQPDSAGLLTGTSIIINGPIVASKHQIFGAGLAVTLGPITTEVPIEWFGGKADATGSVGVGTDNLAPFNAAAAALSAGSITFTSGGYRFSGAVTITKTNTYLVGVTTGYPATAASIAAKSTNLFIDSASADGFTFASTAVWGGVFNLAVLRTQTPTGTAKGISVKAGGVIVENVTSEDSIYPMYFQAANGYGTGKIENVSVGWGYTGLAGTPSPNVCGFYLDDAGGIESASIRFFHDSVSSNLAGAGFTTGLCAVGTNISDLYTDRFETSGTNIGIDLENTGTSGFVSQDIQLVNSVLNTCLTYCLKINGMGSTTDIAPHVFVQGGNYFATGTAAVGILVQNSSNVSLIGMQNFVGNTGSSAQTDIVLNTVDGFQVNDNDFSGGSIINISCISSTHGTMTGNKIKNGNATTGNTGIKNVGCTNVVEQANDIAGNGGVNLLNGITFDATSSGNGPWSLNTIDSATVTTPVTDAGTGNNTLSPSILTLAAGSAMNANQGTGAKVQHSTGTTTTNDCVKFDATGNTVDAGAACGGSATIIQVNGTPTTTATPVNLRNGTGNGGIAVTNPSTGNVDFNLSKPFTTGTNFTTGVASNTLNELAYFPGTDGRVADSTILITDVMQLSGNQTATGTKTLPSPVFTGIPIAPTAAPGTNTTQLATTAFVLANPGSNGLSGMTATQVAIAGSASTITSSKALAGAGTGVVTGPTTSVNNDVVSYNGTSGETKDSGILSSQVVTATAGYGSSILPKSNGGGIGLVASLYQDNGTYGLYNGTAFIASVLNSAAINVCPDTSGSGTAQTCATIAATPFTPVADSCVTYTTTTTNSGAGLTLNVNSLGAKSIAIPGASGWTTTLTAGIIPANKPLNICYDGTRWNVQQTGTSAVASGNTTSTSLTTNRLPKANGANSIIDSLDSDDGTTHTYTGTGGTSAPQTTTTGTGPGSDAMGVAAGTPGAPTGLTNYVGFVAPSSGTPNYRFVLPLANPAADCVLHGAAASGTAPISTMICVGGENVVSFSATPTFSATAASNIIILTGLVTSSTLAAGLAGQNMTLTFCQDATGSRTAVLPTNWHGAFTIGSTASKCSSQSATYSLSQSAWLATSVGVINE